MSSSSFLLLPNDPTKRFCYVNFQVGHMLADCPAMSFLLKCRQKLCLKNKTKNTITNQFRGVTKSIHKLTIWNIGNGAACLKELTRKGQGFCPGDDIIRVNKGRFISVTDDDLAQFCLLMMKVMLWLKWIATQTETSPHSHQDIHQTSLTFKLSQNFIPLHFLLLLFLSNLPITPSSSH